MTQKKVNPALIMHQIRSGVREQTIELNTNKYTEGDNSSFSIDGDYMREIQQLNIKINRLLHRVTPNMPVAFMEPRLVSRYKFLDKFVTPIRKFGNRLFTKWYVDTVSNQQKYLNNELWFGLNSSIEVITEQSKLIAQLVDRISIIDQNNQLLSNELDKLKSEQNNLSPVVMKLKQKYLLNDNFQYSCFAKNFTAAGEDVKRIFKQYLKYIEENEIVVDIGCGKGYFLELLSEHNLNGVGIDTDVELVEECKSKKLQAYVDEGNEYLLKQNNSSIDVVFLAHVIEHLTVPQKITFLELCYQKLKKGGKLIIETPNTTSGYVMNNLYYLDPTHERPLLPEGLKHLAQMNGFKVINSYLSEEISFTDSATKQYYNYSLILQK
ncbi:class I SAM-dependent methyltransferase [Paenibacillus glucanolyticus]|uniref:class I SAM-dependent methyltransferase n=1 Tax=Paenibacillus glucanolyticus TaxID=59843 RepID=UPI0034CE6DB0